MLALKFNQVSITVHAKVKFYLLYSFQNQRPSVLKLLKGSIAMVLTENIGIQGIVSFTLLKVDYPVFKRSLKRRRIAHHISGQQEIKKQVHNRISPYYLKNVNWMGKGPPKKWQLDQRKSLLQLLGVLSFTINSLMIENTNHLNKNHIVYHKVQNKCLWFTSYYKLCMLIERETKYILQYASKF